ncbi:MAG: hypothetical protein LBI55_01665 [Oscillospiraceae bacterium]|jgi:uncharacterized protein|nr:hypothetical protein [Oscillospiraceae bacterium]
MKMTRLHSGSLSRAFKVNVDCLRHVVRWSEIKKDKELVNIKLSRFILPLRLDSSCFILFNTLSKSVVRVDENMCCAMKDEKWQEISLADINCLKKTGFIVESLDDEKKLFINNTLSKIRDDKHFNLHLLATTACNFRCSYCFQDGVRSNSFKLGETDRLLVPIEKYLIEYGIKTLSIVFYGGSPH